MRGCFREGGRTCLQWFIVRFTMGYSSFMGGMFTPYNDILSNDGLFKIQSDAIRKLAETESCVLVGRCADYILRDDPACLSFFIHSSVESRVQKSVERHGVTVEEAKNMMEKTDKSRAAYYNYYRIRHGEWPLLIISRRCIRIRDRRDRGIYEKLYRAQIE